jgi:hypothetical protein
MCSFAGLVVSGQGVDFLGFMERHPSILFKMITFGLASAAGQVSGRFLCKSYLSLYW